MIMPSLLFSLLNLYSVRFIDHLITHLLLYLEVHFFTLISKSLIFTSRHQNVKIYFWSVFMGIFHSTISGFRFKQNVHNFVDPKMYTLSMIKFSVSPSIVQQNKIKKKCMKLKKIMRKKIWNHRQFPSDLGC